MKLYPAPKYKTFIELKANGKRAIRIHNGNFMSIKKGAEINIEKIENVFGKNSAFTVRRLTVDKRHDLYNFAKAHFDV